MKRWRIVYRPQSLFTGANRGGWYVIEQYRFGGSKIAIGPCVSLRAALYAISISVYKG